MDFTKIDFSKFDVAKLFDVDAAISSMEMASKKATDLITDAKAKSMVEAISGAWYDYARAQAAAARAFGEAIKQATQI